MDWRRKTKLRSWQGELLNRLKRCRFHKLQNFPLLFIFVFGVKLKEFILQSPLLNLEQIHDFHDFKRSNILKRPKCPLIQTFEAPQITAL